MKVYLLKDIERVGMTGEIIKVSSGYAQNFLFPRKFAIEVTTENEHQFIKKIELGVKRKEVVATKTSMLAEKIKSLELKIARKMHDQDKLYGALSASDLVDLLAQHGVNVAKNQIEFDKQIKTKGLHTFTVKLSNSLKPVCSVRVVPGV